MTPELQKIARKPSRDAGREVAAALSPRQRILRLVEPEGGGPRSRVLLEAMAVHYGAGPELVREMIASGELAQYGHKRGTRWGLPG